MASTLADTMFTKLSTHYPAMATAKATLDDLLQQFAIDNPTYLRPLGTPTFYTAGPTETLNDAAYRWWTAYVP